MSAEAHFHLKGNASEWIVESAGNPEVPREVELSVLHRHALFFEENVVSGDSYLKMLKKCDFESHKTR